jgi:hypothetical protein
MTPPAVGVSLMCEPAFARAVLPLFEAGAIDAIEWSFDTRCDALPAWADALIRDADAAGALYGHGVYGSPLSPADPPPAWLDRLGAERAARRYRHVSDHFGFSTAGAIVRGAPMPVPFCTAAVDLGRRWLAATRAHVVPFGLENLALALSRRDALEQGAFVDRLLGDDDDGFVVLDLHNLWCQAVNFELEPAALLASWPLHRVRELHVAGGRWARVASDPRPFRRDTHDAPIPDEVLALVPLVLASCPRVEVVIIERLGNSLRAPADEAALRDDVLRTRDAVRAARPAPITAAITALPFELDAPSLAAYQRALVEQPAAGASPAELHAALHAIVPDYACELERRCLETVIELSARWAHAAGRSR